MPLVSVLEVNPSGHRLHYVRHLVDGAGPEHCILLTSDAALKSEELRVHAESMTGPTVVLPASGSRRALLEAAVAEAETAGARRLIVPDGDHYLSSLVRLMMRRPSLRLEVRLLLMRTTTLGGPERLRPATLIKPLLTRFVSLFPQVKVLFLTDALGVVTRRRGFVGLPAVKDPVRPPGDEPRTRPDWLPPTDPTRTVVGMFGHITPRKNLPLLVEAISGMPEVTLVVAGEMADRTRAYTESDGHARELAASGRMIVVDRHLGTDELAAGLAMVDLVAVLNENDSPSGILAEACVRGTPTLVPRGGWLAEVVDTTGIGVSTGLAAEQVADGIRRLVRDRSDHAEAIHRNSPRIDTTDFVDRLLGS